MSHFKSIIQPKNHGYALEVEADSIAVEIKLTDSNSSSARVTTFTARELDAIISALQGARAVMSDP